MSAEWFFPSEGLAAFAFTFSAPYRAYLAHVSSLVTETPCVNARGVRQPYLVVWAGVSHEARPLQSTLIDEILREFPQARVGPCVLEGGIERDDEVFGVFDVTNRYREYAAMISRLCAPYAQVVHTAQSIPFAPLGHGVRPGVLAPSPVEIGHSLLEPTGLVFGAVQPDETVDPLCWFSAERGEITLSAAMRARARQAGFEI